MLAGSSAIAHGPSPTPRGAVACRPARRAAPARMFCGAETAVRARAAARPGRAPRGGFSMRFFPAVNAIRAFARRGGNSGKRNPRAMLHRNIFAGKRNDLTAMQRGMRTILRRTPRFTVAKDRGDRLVLRCGMSLPPRLGLCRIARLGLSSLYLGLAPQGGGAHFFCSSLWTSRLRAEWSRSRRRVGARHFFPIRKNPLRKGMFCRPRRRYSAARAFGPRAASAATSAAMSAATRANPSVRP